MGGAILVIAGISTAMVGYAANVTVHCGGGGDDAFPSISAALAHLDARGPNTLMVYGACKENISITLFNRLTLNAAAGASISDASAGANSVIAITDSQTVIISGFTINGAVVCQTVSTCAFIGDTLQNSPGDGLQVVDSAYALLSGGTITNNPSGRGLLIASGSHVNASGITVSNNGAANQSSGIRLQGAVLLLTGSTVSGNGFHGVALSDHSTLHSIDNTVTGNAFSGVAMRTSSEARFTRATTGNLISGNGDYGVLIADLSLGNSDTAGNSMSGNHTTLNTGQPDVQCIGRFSAAVGEPLAAGTVGATCGGP
jgi:hypothetical protein